MPRILSVALLILVVLLTGAALVWYFAYGYDEQPPGRAAVAGLGADVQVGWHADGTASIEAGSEADAFAALGFVHGQARTWSVSLWRQTAVGGLGAWFGPDVLAIDRLVHRLGIPEAARAAYDALDDPDRALLDAYARGMNAALETRHVRTDEAFARLDVAPEAWAPWHTLAVERLFAWLAATRPDADSVAAAGPDVAAFFADDRRLQDWLHVYGLRNSIAWAVSDSAGTHFFQRHVTGASAIPLYQEVRLSWSGGPVVEGLSLPGTPFFPGGTSEDRAWAYFPTSAPTLVRAPEPDAAPRFVRLTTIDGAEHLITIRRAADAVVFASPTRRPPPPDSLRTTAADSLGALGGTATVRDTLTVSLLPPVTPDTTWTLRWRGLAPGTDLGAWRALLTGDDAVFALAGGFGLAATPDGRTSVLGDPALSVAAGGGALVGGAPWIRYAGQRMDSLRAAGTPPAAWPDDAVSTWAAALAPALIASVDSLDGIRMPPVVADALTYLRNWDYRYARTSIAATIFDSWVESYRDSTGALPSLSVPDSVFFEDQRRYTTLVQTAARLRQQYGTNLQDWRWENVMPDERAFPVWSAADRLAQRPAHLARTHYGPLRLPGQGHPTALAWGSSPVFRDIPTPTVHEATVSTSSWSTLEVRRRRFDLERFLGRYRTLRRRPAFEAPFSAPAETTTVLRPADG